MSETSEMNNDRDDEESGRIPFAQQLLDRPFFWLAAGFVVILAFYTVWGVVEIVTMPQSALP